MPHDITLRGFGAELYSHLRAAVDDAIEPPLEIVGEGRAGTGKSMGWLGALIAFASKYPNVPGRVLIARLTRHSLTSSSCVTIRKILYSGHPMLEGPSDAHRQYYRLGAWEFVLSGLDNIDNLLSTEWDFIGAEELRQLPLRVWEEFSRGVRNYALYRYDADGNLAPPGEGVSRIPFGIVLGATNPWTPKHWILTRAKRRKLKLVHTIIQENPAYYDENGRITPMGEVYQRRMAQLTGVRFKRLVLGEWCAAEGVIYDMFEGDISIPNPSVCRIPRDSEGWIPRKTLQELKITEFYAGVDYGDDAAGCMVVAGLTTDRRLIVVAELYARRRDLDWWQRKVKAIHQHYPISLGFCDHNRGDWTRAFNDVVGAPREGPGTVFINADKGVDRGIQVMRLRINRRTLIYDLDPLLHEPDPDLIEAGLPVCTIDEIPEYVWARDEDDDDQVSQMKPNDKPDSKCHDHGCDASRYLCVGVDYFVPDGILADPTDTFGSERFRRLMELTRSPKSREWVDPDEEEGQEDPQELRARMVREALEDW